MLVYAIYHAVYMSYFVVIDLSFLALAHENFTIS